MHWHDLLGLFSQRFYILRAISIAVLKVVLRAYFLGNLGKRLGNLGLQSGNPGPELKVENRKIDHCMNAWGPFAVF